jgi:ABC-type spermidine/putrescine transport system permease subunit I
MSTYDTIVGAFLILSMLGGGAVLCFAKPAPRRVRRYREPYPYGSALIVMAFWAVIIAVVVKILG